MTAKLYGYLFLHGNLNFSCIPKSEYSKVIDSCYWPMVNIIDEGCKMGLEFPADTLIEIDQIDSSLIKKIKELAIQKKCTIIASGFSQIIMPLNPALINDKSIQYGKEVYETYFDDYAKIFFIPEQTFSKNLASIILDHGYKTMIMDWDNASEHNLETRKFRYSPAFLKDYPEMNVLWNSSMNSYKFQRYIYGRISIKDYVDGIMDHYSKDENRSLCLYGTDWEIFNYRPPTHEVFESEIGRVKTLFDYFNTLEQLEIIRPEEILDILPPKEEVSITSAEIPITCKNRDDYNVTRWSVSGRDNVYQNTKCFQITKKMASYEIKTNKKLDDKNWKNLIRLFGSDYRTKTTNEKYYDFWEKSSIQNNLMQEHQSFDHLQIKSPNQIMNIINPYDIDFKNIVIEKKIHFKQGLFKNNIEIISKDSELLTQIEDKEHYQDGSLRSINLVIFLDIKSKEKILLSFLQEKKSHRYNYTMEINGPLITCETPHIQFKSNSQTGGDIRSLVFKKISKDPLIKYLPPVYFDNIAYSNDYYSGWNQTCIFGGDIHHDTLPSKFIPDPGLFKIRIPILFKVPFYNGFILKKYFIYKHDDRIDMTHRFYFPNHSPVFLRSGILTINPEAFSKGTLRYSTTNGTDVIDSYPLKDKIVKHTHFPSQNCSAKACLGTTEDWYAIHDESKGIGIISDKSNLYHVPLIEYEQINQTYLLRTHHSIAESDDTGKLLYKGHHELKLSLFGFKDHIEQIRHQAYLSQYPLIIE